MKKHVSLVLGLRDGCRGLPLGSLNSVQVTLDGERYLPVYKAGGWFVFVDLQPGPHRVVLSGRKFLSEQVDVDIPETGTVELHRSLQPSPYYPFPDGMTCVTATVEGPKGPAANTEVLLVSPLEKDLFKVAEDDAAAGKRSVKLFAAQKKALAGVPGAIFLVDGPRSELCALTGREEDIYQLGAPLTPSHKRGTALRAVRRYVTDETGSFFAALESAGEMTAYVHAGKGYVEQKFAVEAGKEQAVSLKLAKV